MVDNISQIQYQREWNCGCLLIIRGRLDTTTTLGIFMFTYMNGELPDAFDSMFSYRHDIHDYNTRGANQFHMEQFPANIGL